MHDFMNFSLIISVKGQVNWLKLAFLTMPVAKWEAFGIYMCEMSLLSGYLQSSDKIDKINWKFKVITNRYFMVKRD